MRILAIESSCDETGAAVIEKNKTTIKVLSNITATSLAIHAATGGIIPENAAREQVKYIIPTIIKALCKSRIVNQESWEEARIILKKEIDAIAVTHGPGLIGSLLVGVETAKTLSFAFNKPIIPVHHLLAHMFEHAHTGQRIVGPFLRRLPVVRHQHPAPVLKPRSLDALICQPGLRFGQRDARGFDTIALGGIHRQSAPSAADIQQSLSRPQPQFSTDVIQFICLRRIQVFLR